MGWPWQGHCRVGRKRSGCFLHLWGGRSGTIFEKVSGSAGCSVSHLTQSLVHLKNLSGIYMIGEWCRVEDSSKIYMNDIICEIRFLSIFFVEQLAHPPSLNAIRDFFWWLRSVLLVRSSDSRPSFHFCHSVPLVVRSPSFFMHSPIHLTLQHLCCCLVFSIFHSVCIVACLS